MSYLRSAVTATAIPAAIFLTSLSPSSSNSPCAYFSKTTLNTSSKYSLIKSLATPPSAVQMDTHHKLSPQNDANNKLPQLLTEFMVDMKCDGCVNAVKNKLQSVNGVKDIEVDLSNQVVRILGSSPVKTMTEALEQTGRTARLIGQGIPDDFLVSAAVAEFKGPNIFGVVRVAQVNMELARIEANFSGLSSGKHGWSINEFGDLTEGAASTGKIFSPSKGMTEEEPLGDLGTLDVDANGEAFFTGVKPKLRVSDLIGRSIVVYETEDKMDRGVTAAVIARSAGVGENYKKLCTCDGTTIWEASDSDFVTSKV